MLYNICMKSFLSAFIITFCIMVLLFFGFFYSSTFELVEYCKESGLSLSEALTGEDDYEDYSSGHYYELLDENEKYVYRKIDEAHNESRTTVSFSTDEGVETERISHVFMAYLNDHPGVFNYSPYIKHTVTNFGNLNHCFVTSEKSDEIVSESDIKHKVEELTKNIDINMDEEDIILEVNNLICENFSYDTRARFSGDIRSMTLENTGVCIGYSQLFKLCMDYLGIDCVIINGTSVIEEEERGHSWNAVNIDDEWKYIDVTWSDQEKAGYINYDFFLRSEDDFPNHKPNDEFDMNFLR